MRGSSGCATTSTPISKTKMKYKSLKKYIVNKRIELLTIMAKSQPEDYTENGFTQYAQALTQLTILDEIEQLCKNRNRY